MNNSVDPVQFVINLANEIAKPTQPTKEDPVKTVNEEPHICDNPYHQIPVHPQSGHITFRNNNAEDILATLKSLLGDMKVNMTVSWDDIVSNDVRSRD